MCQRSSHAWLRLWVVAGMIASLLYTSGTSYAAEAAERDTAQINQPGLGMDKEQIPPRHLDTEDSCIDLSEYYNAGLIGSWQSVNSVRPASLQLLPNDLVEIPTGEQSFDGVVFDIRGVVQLLGSVMKSEGAVFPESVEAIQVGRPFTKLHVLHATSWQEEHGKPIGIYRLNYADGSAHEYEIEYGKQVLDWWRYVNEKMDLQDTVIAWKGSNALSREIVRSQRNYRVSWWQSLLFGIFGYPADKAEENVDAGTYPIRLFKTTWENPRPDVRVESVDYISSMTNCAPFVVAMTVE